MGITKERVMEIFASDTAEELAEKYSKLELGEYYKILYGSYPKSGWRKIDIIRGIKLTKESIDRAQALKP